MTTKTKKTPGQIEQEINAAMNKGTLTRRMIASRVYGLRRERTREAAREGLSSLGRDDEEDYDIDAEITKLAVQIGVDPKIVAPRKASRKIRSTSILALAAAGVGIALGLSGIGRSRR